jgi:hypothetical protein
VGYLGTKTTDSSGVKRRLFQTPKLYTRRIFSQFL